MEIKLPKKISIGCFTFNVVADPKTSGGSFSLSKSEMRIGTKHIKDDASYTFNIICHEVLEACMVISNLRYDDTSVIDNYKFFMDHKEFQSCTELFSVAIRQFIK